MKLSHDQVDSLLSLVATAEVDRLDCDGCLDRIAEFADSKLQGHELTDAMLAVEVHLRQCVCCRVEYETLLDGLRALEE